MDFDPALLRLGWTPARRSQLESLADPTLVPARVSIEHRGAYALAGSAQDSARLAGRLRLDGATRPVVGDWVAARPQADYAVIEAVLPRTGLLERKRPGAAGAQPVAANVDVAFIVTSAERPPNLRRVERTMAIAAAGGARPVIVLNKIDLAADSDADLRSLARVSGGAPCVATSAATSDGIGRLRAELTAGMTGALLGPSGAGKSSLVNALLGESRLATGAVRVTDVKGRHTTTRRELIEIPDGGCLIDNPGMRELGLWRADEGIDATFDDVAALAANCRFSDCRHRGEPGCAVASALATGELDPSRFESFEKLRREEAFVARQQDPRDAADAKQRGKAIHKQQRARRRVDPKLRDD